MLLAQTVQALGEGGKLLAERELGWNRGTIRKGMHEVEHGIVCVDAFSSRGRKRSEDHLPNLLSDITAIAVYRAHRRFIGHEVRPHESGEEKTVYHRPMGADKSAVSTMNRPLPSLA